MDPLLLSSLEYGKDVLVAAPLHHDEFEMDFYPVMDDDDNYDTTLTSGTVLDFDDYFRSNEFLEALGAVDVTGKEDNIDTRNGGRKAKEIVPNRRTASGQGTSELAEEGQTQDTVKRRSAIISVDEGTVRPVGGGKKKAKVGPSSRRSSSGVQRPAGMPKRPMSAYNVFFKSERPKIFEERAGSSERISFQELGKIIGQRWQLVSTEERKEYAKLAAVDADRYRKEMEAYKPTLDRILSGSPVSKPAPVQKTRIVSPCKSPRNPTKVVSLEASGGEVNAAPNLGREKILPKGVGEVSPLGSSDGSSQPGADSKIAIQPPRPSSSPPPPPPHWSNSGSWHLRPAYGTNPPPPSVVSSSDSAGGCYHGPDAAAVAYYPPQPKRATPGHYGTPPAAHQPQSDGRRRYCYPPPSERYMDHAQSQQLYPRTGTVRTLDARTGRGPDDDLVPTRGALAATHQPHHQHHSAMSPPRKEYVLRDPRTGRHRPYTMQYRCFRMKLGQARSYFTNCCGTSVSDLSQPPEISMDQLLRAPPPPGEEVPFSFLGDCRKHLY
jgi:HMG (high mobility group) box